jgi:hypothetical protein
MRIKVALSAIAISTLVLVSSPAIGDQFGVPNENARGYWNESRLANAQPIELIVDETTGIGKLRVNAQAGRPSGKTTSGSTTKVSTSDWPQGSPIAQTAVGKVFFTVGVNAYVCSGALATDGVSTRAIVLTAGHCVWSQGTTGAFVTNWAFYPNYDAGNRIAYYSSALVVRNEFATQTSFNNTALANDWAFAVINPGGLNPSTLPDVDFQGITKNSYDLNVSGFTTGYTSYAFGYPQASPFNGLTLKYAGATIFVDTNTKTTWGMNSTMTGGASGGPWLSNGSLTTADAVNGKLSSLNSYKYNLDSTKMYGPFFNARTTSTFTAALTAVGNLTISN